jgi:hypothetical protein
MIRALAIDPGGTTGFALAMVEGLKINLISWQKALSHREFWLEVDGQETDYIVCESFEYRPGKWKASIDLTPPELIGVLKANVYPDDLYFQTAAIGKAYYTDQKLKDVKLYKAGEPHGRDALRHLLHWLNFGAGFQFLKANSQWVLQGASAGE